MKKDKPAVPIGHRVYCQATEPPRLPGTVWFNTGSSAAPQNHRMVFSGVDTIDSSNSTIFMVKPYGTIGSATLKLLGLPFLDAFYTELGSHAHGGMPTMNHTHQGASHQHGIGSLTVSASGTTANATLYYAGGASNDHNHTVSVSGTVGGAMDASGTGNTGSPNEASGNTNSSGITGTTLNDTRKTAVDDSITVAFSTDGATWTTKTKASTGWSTLANINTATGTAEIDISALLTAGVVNYIKVAEPTAKKGGRISWLCMVS